MVQARYRKFNGKTFEWKASGGKSAAKYQAMRYREQGYRARVVKSGQFYTVYRSKSKRK